MRTLIAFVAVLVVANALDQDFIDELLEKVQEVGTACAEETGATPDDIAELVSRQIPPSRREGKCMIFCVQRSFKMMKPDGSVDRAGAMLALRPLQQADPEVYKKVLKLFIICGMRVKPVPDPCEMASALAECGKDEAEALGLDESLLMA